MRLQKRIDPFARMRMLDELAFKPRYAVNKAPCNVGRAVAKRSGLQVWPDTIDGYHQKAG